RNTSAMPATRHQERREARGHAARRRSARWSLKSQASGVRIREATEIRERSSAGSEQPWRAWSRLDDDDGMELLVLGGTHFVGRNLVAEALRRGDDVTTLTRGRSGPPAAGARARYADRSDPAQLVEALGDDTWDAVIDTWSGAPEVVHIS